ncbi:MAG: HAMP domain-containing histidine kinase [Magnetococcales bacterium]|nr:HAMP domain-containing histidine kinase [Magnetococcales bacterium]MBF0150265.1 HAMP domain-containing histidine kinase [Magnetococcales bacterium]MBF0172153.1 HAMP domain-containing histidine kinase [Magnetococcales bacterium]MBF0347953.1 HAMP domain-containing histidine kinase [Magnetococcales bacterium]MBF0630547.1 HAMP domain-containing histidine kinase [Magnetococcales bacterium]
MARLSDEELIAELKKRFDATKQALYDVKMVTSKLEEVNKKLQASEQIKSNFISHMKNEINNPLTSILGLSEQLRSGLIPPEMTQSIATSIHSEAFSLDFQLRNIFAAAEMESGETQLQISLTDVLTLIRDSIDSFNHLIADKNLTVTLPEKKEDDDQLLFKTDTEKLSLIFSNLISNAVEFNHENGAIEINATILNGRLNVTIRDTGPGIDPEKIHTIFDRFVQLESGVRKSHKGHGLGLSIVQALVEMMEGNITVDSVAKGKGTIFSVSIPEVQTNMEADAFSVDGNEFFFDDEEVKAF